MSSQPPEGSGAPSWPEGDPLKKRDPDTPDTANPWARPESSPPATDPTAPGSYQTPPGQPAEPFDPYRFGPPSPNPFGYPESATPGSGPAGSGPTGSGSPPPSPTSPMPPYQSQYQAQYPPTGYPAPPSTHRYPAPKSRHGKAIAALVLGIAALVFFWTTIFDIPLIVLGIVFGALGISAAKRGAGGKGMAVTGLICAIVGAIAAVVFFVFIAHRATSCADKYGTGSNAYELCIRNGN